MPWNSLRYLTRSPRRAALVVVPTQRGAGWTTYYQKRDALAAAAEAAAQMSAMDFRDWAAQHVLVDGGAFASTEELVAALGARRRSRITAAIANTDDAVTEQFLRAAIAEADAAYPGVRELVSAHRDDAWVRVSCQSFLHLVELAGGPELLRVAIDGEGLHSAPRAVVSPEVAVDAA
jgi:hypothetical protein